MFGFTSIRLKNFFAYEPSVKTCLTKYKISSTQIKNKISDELENLD